MTKRIEGMCPHCGWRYDVLLAHANSGLVPKHDHPTQEKAMCPGSDQGPRNPESDRRPLWKDLPNAAKPVDPPQVTVNALRTLLLPAGKDWGVLIAGTPEDTQFVTWGRSPENKCYASDLSEHLGKELCGDTPFVVYESFKLDAAKNKARVEELEKERVWLLRCEAAIKSMAAQFICPKTTPEEMVDQILKGENNA